jgi:hypothetical protein
MTRRLTAATVATIAALAPAGVAAADHGKHGANVYRATVAKTAAADAAQLPDVRGRAQLVDGKKNNKVSIHVKGLKPGQTYKWHVHSDAATNADPCAAQTGPIVPGWTYRGSTTPNEGVLTANQAGNASGKGRSTTFAAEAGKVYFVNVHLADGTPIACGVLTAKAKKPHGKPAAHPEHPSTPHRSEEGEAHGHGPKPGKGPGA